MTSAILLPILTGVTGMLIGWIISQFLNRNLRDQISNKENKHLEQMDALHIDKRSAYDNGYNQGVIEGEKRASAQSKADIVTSYYNGVKDGREAADKEWKVEVIPFYRLSKIGIVGFKKNHYEFGYEHQLLIKGIPSVKFPETIIGSEKETELDKDDLVKLTEELVSAAVSGAGLNTHLQFKKPIEKLLPKAKP